MKKRAIEEYYLGLDIGTNSVGYAVTDPQYKILKYHGEPMWGSHVFEEGSQCAERRGFRTARRRLNRRQQRVRLVQEIFAHEIEKVDSRFFLRLKESALYREDANGNDPFILFNDEGYTDKEYYLKYPTIHHLIMDLIDDENPHDVRLVYLAVAWLVAHRGHFLSDVEKTNVEKVLDFSTSYNALKEMYSGIGQDLPWIDEEETFKNILLEKCGVKDKERAFKDKLLKNNSNKKNSDITEESEVLGTSAVITLLSGGTVTADKLFMQAEFQDKISISFKKNEDEFEQILTELDEYAEYLLKIRAVYDWAVLYEASKGQVYISKAKIEVYEQHKKDLAGLKAFIRKYCPDKYNEIFRDAGDNNYVAYSYNFNSLENKKVRPKEKAKPDKFCDCIKKIVRNIKCEVEDMEFYEDMLQRLELVTFMPKQVCADNRIIPYQLYYFELNRLLEKVSIYLPFINEKDVDGYITKNKLLSIMEFRIPYYVGPLHKENSSFAWIERKAKGRIYPWNYEEKIDLDASEQAFIDKMTNQCSYLPGEDVLPKYSLLYCKYEVLNEINNIKINGQKITVECKKGIFGLFKRNKKVTVKKIKDFLISNNYMSASDEMTGLDISVKSSLKSYHDFRKMLENKIVNEEDVEEIIKRLTYTEDKKRINKYLEENYPNISEEDRRYISKLKYKDFGRLSEKFLTGIKGVVRGGKLSVIQMMWETNDNLMQIIFSDHYMIKDALERERKDYYSEHPASVEQILSDMYVSNAVKRPIYRTLDIISDVTKACQNAPRKIFVEMARGGGEKGKRTVSRRNTIKELYKNMDRQEVREISKLLDEKTDNELQSEVLFLYFMQLGKCMYSGEPIDIQNIKMKTYVNVDHIYPQAYVKDDSLDNKVLVKSKLNEEKSDDYPINKDIQEEMSSIWKHYRNEGLISEEKYNRLTRKTKFTNEEKQGFVNRQLVETRQSTKAVAEILKMMFPEPETEVVYVKAGLATAFRSVFGPVKCRQINDLHHAKDAYLNVVCGNVYHSTFTKKFFQNNPKYSIKTETVYKRKIEVDGKPIWNGQESLSFVIKMLGKNNIHYTRYAFCRTRGQKGGFFGQQPKPAGADLVPRKKNLPSEKYGGYNGTTVTYFVMAKYTEKVKKEKTDIMIVSVELLYSHNLLQNEEFAVNYIRQEIARIANKKQEEIVNISFPLGLRPLKVNTRFSFDGFEACIASKKTYGQQLGMCSLMSLKLSEENMKYVKKIENYLNKKNANKNIVHDEQYDEINSTINIKLYGELTEKLLNTCYRIVYEKTGDIILKGKDKFENLSFDLQCQILMNIIDVLKTGRNGGCNLKDIGGSVNEANYIINSRISNWKKNYKCVKIIDESASGIFRKESENILEWL